MNALKRWSIAGAVTIMGLGFVLHYIYTWSGHSALAGFFVPVNESAWEHLKLGYWSLALFSAVEYPFLRKHANNYFIAKTVGLLVLELSILAIFYGYMAISHRDIFWLDILSYLLGVLLCQYLAYRLLRLGPLSAWLNRLGLALFVAIGLLFGLATFYPPQSGLFQDSRTCSFGIPGEQ